jgi:hypothetical protein
MKKPRNYLEVNKEKETRFYRICQELMEEQESYIRDAHNEEWSKTLTNFGIKARPLIREGLLDPIWRTKNRSKRDERLIKVPKGVIIEEKTGVENSFFKFKRINRRI